MPLLWREAHGEGLREGKKRICDSAYRIRRCSHPEHGFLRAFTSFVFSNMAPETIPRHMVLRISLAFPNSAVYLDALIDSGATANFISNSLIEGHRATPTAPVCPDAVYAIDGRRLKPGSVYDISISPLPSKSRTSVETFISADIEYYDIILSLLWLEKHNPQINWRARILTILETIPDAEPTIGKPYK